MKKARGVRYVVDALLYDNEKVMVPIDVVEDYPKRIFYKRFYKKGDRVTLLCDCYSAKEHDTGEIYQRSKGFYYYVKLDRSESYGVEIHAKGIKKLG